MVCGGKGRMNNDLISRSAVIKLIDELGYVNCHDGKDYAANSRVDKIRQKIMEQPTAYDVDKVVELLDTECKYEDVPVYEGDAETDYYIRMEKAVEIVKSGGIE